MKYVPGACGAGMGLVVPEELRVSPGARSPTKTERSNGSLLLGVTLDVLRRISAVERLALPPVPWLMMVKLKLTLFPAAPLGSTVKDFKKRSGEAITGNAQKKVPTTKKRRCAKMDMVISLDVRLKASHLL